MLIASSGGVDSSVLLAAAARVLPRDRVLAVTATSATFPRSELKIARMTARRLGVRHKVIRGREFENSSFVANPARRCYFCKRELFGLLRAIARQEGLAAVLDGTNYDDRRDSRPGRQAARELGVVSPLQQARLTKPELRRLARRYRLSNWDKPAAACLASRVPYGTRLEPGLLRRIDRAEQVLAGLGFSQIRVRHHGPIARIELNPREFTRVIMDPIRYRLVASFKRLGYRYVALDLAGYRSGSMNAGLPATRPLDHLTT